MKLLQFAWWHGSLHGYDRLYVCSWCMKLVPNISVKNSLLRCGLLLSCYVPSPQTLPVFICMLFSRIPLFVFSIVNLSDLPHHAEDDKSILPSWRSLFFSRQQLEEASFLQLSHSSAKHHLTMFIPRHHVHKCIFVNSSSYVMKSTQTILQLQDARWRSFFRPSRAFLEHEICHILGILPIRCCL